GRAGGAARSRKSGSAVTEAEVALLAPEEVDRRPQAFFETVRRRVSEHRSRVLDVGGRVAYVAGPGADVNRLDGRADELGDRPRELVHRPAPSGGDVEDLARDLVGLARQEVRLDDLPHEREIAGLLSIAVDHR